MFVEGQLGAVIGSNKITGAGPRVGSLGYIEKTGVLAMHRTKEGCWIIQPARVNFVRYGYEQKERSETKAVILVLPTILIDNPHAENSILKALKTISRINATTNDAINDKWLPDDPMWWEGDIKISTLSSFVCMVAAPQFSKFNTDSLHFVSWAKSLKYNRCFISGLEAINQNIDLVSDIYGLENDLLRFIVRAYLEQYAEGSLKDNLTQIANSLFLIKESKRIIRTAFMICQQREIEEEIVKKFKAMIYRRCPGGAGLEDTTYIEMYKGFMMPMILEKKIDILRTWPKDRFGKTKAELAKALQNYAPILHNISNRVLSQ